MPKAELIRTKDAAAVLHVHRSTLTRMVETGKLKPAVRGEGVRGEMFFYASDIERMRRAAERAA